MFSNKKVNLAVLVLDQPLLGLLLFNLVLMWSLTINLSFIRQLCPKSCNLFSKDRIYIKYNLTGNGLHSYKAAKYLAVLQFKHVYNRNSVLMSE